jgi:hypothetical protein
MLRIFPGYSLTIVLLVFPVVAAAQPHWDAAGTAGVLGSHSPDVDGRRHVDDWFHVAQGGLIVGRHVSTHLKVEIDASVSTAGRQYVEWQVNVPGFPYPYPLVAELRTSVRSLGAALTWQFGDNDWVHPFVRGGVSADFERQHTRTWDQVIYRTDPSGVSVPLRVAGPDAEGAVTTTTARVTAGGGAKFYVSPRLFVRSEGMLAWGRARQNVVLRVGLGLDF